MLSNEFKVNAALSETADAFDPQLPLGGPMQGNVSVPAGIELQNGGKAILRFNAPKAQSVIVHIGTSEGPVTPLAKGSDGVWSATLTIEQLKAAGSAPYIPLFYEVDGTYALNPMSPIGWSHAHPINIIDFPAADIDYYLAGHGALAQDVPHGTVVRDYYYSKTCGCMKSCLIYTPPGYNRGEGTNLPVLYLQHGYGENETSWVHLGKANWIMDNLLAEGKAKPMLIVMNNGMVQTESENGTRTWDAMSIERLLLDDCIPHIEANYRVAADKWSRAMAGLSMGSMQTSVVTLSHPELFAYAGIFSGFLGMLGPLGANKNAHFKAFDDKAKLEADYKLFFRCIGDTDHLAEQFHSESKLLADKGLAPESGWAAHKQVIYAGGHDWNVWRPCLRDFLTMLFK